MDTLRSEFETRGLDVTTTGSVGDALRLVEGSSFDVALVDGALGGAEGAKLVRCIREARPEVEVIVMASQPTAQQAVDILRSGAFAFLAKPESESVLWRWITDAIASSRYRRIEQAQQTVDRILDGQPD